VNLFFVNRNALLAIFLMVCGKVEAIECAPVLRQVGASRFLVTVAEDGITPKQQAEILEVLRSVDDLISPTLKVPPQQSVALSLRGKASYDLQTVFAPYQIEFEIKLKSDDAKLISKHPSMSKAGQAHEYGHAIFDLNLEGRVPGFKDSLDRLRIVDAAHTRWQNSLGEIAKIESEMKSRGLIAKNDLRVWESISRDRLADGSINGGTPKKFSDPIFEQWSAAKKRSLDLRAAIPDLLPDDVRMLTRREPYSELFCDSLAVLLYNDGSAVHRGVYLAGIYAHKDRAEAIRSTEGRDFTARIKPETWRNNTAHGLLGPARAHLWKNYFSNPRYVDKKAEMLDLLLDVIADELKGAGDMEPRAINERAIRAIDEKFKILANR
jgi:hypothetical protein